MLLYRICTNKELNLILTNNFSEVGSFGAELIEYQKEKGMNTHKYEADKYYMHFYKDKDNVLFGNTSAGNYVCTYDIPDEILDNSFGYGQYLSPFNLESIVSVPEYAIESNIIKKEYIKRIEIIKETIEFCDDDYPNSLDDFFESVYVKVLQR